MSHIGTNKIGKVYLGDTEIAKAYLGSNLVYQNGPAVTIPYVTSGLVVYLDAIWNNGLGKHVSSTNTWKDLSGNGHDATGNKTISFSDNYADLIRNSSFSVDNLSISGAKTIELVASFTDRNTTNTGWGQWGKNVYFLGMSNYNCIVRKSNYSSVAISSVYYGSTAGVPIHGCLRFSSDKIELFGDLTLKKTANTSDYPSLEHFDLNRKRDVGTRACPGHAYSLRIYNRALTDDELASNYAIDIQRFGFGN